MNTELLKKLKAIVNAEKRWNQRAYFGDGIYAPFPRLPFQFMVHHCESTACVAGWACILSKSELNYIPMGDPYVFIVENAACNAMGISRFLGKWLFSAHRTKEEIIEVLDLLIKDGNENGVEKYLNEKGWW